MSTSKRAVSTAVTVVAGLAILGGAAVANAASNTPAPTPSAGSSNSAPSSPGTAGDGTSGAAGQGRQGRAPHEHTAVTGDELAKVTAAVTAKDSAVTVSTVQKDPDGSYDVIGTKDGANIRFEVSADLATITQGGGGRGMGGPRDGGANHTVVTGDELTKVTDAVKAKDSALTVERVMKDADGSYDVMATKDGQRVHVDVSADLATITQSQPGEGGKGGRGGHPRGDGGQQGQTQPSTGSTAQPSTGSSTQG